MSIRIASFDIGKKNFAHYVEDADVKMIVKCEKLYQSLPKKIQRRTKGHMDSQISTILKTLYYNSSTVHMGVYDLRNEGDITKYDMTVRKNIIQHLENYRWLWDTCNVIVIEQQFFRTFGGRSKKGKSSEANVDAIKIGELTMTWFLLNFPNREVICFGSQYKTQILGAPEGLTKDQRKKWSVVKAKKILELRSENETLEKLIKCKRGGQKLDDVCDCLVQCQAFKYRHFIADF